MPKISWLCDDGLDKSDFFIFEKENIRASDEENDSSAVDQLKTSIFWWDEKVQKSISNVKIFRDKKSLEQTKYFDCVSFPGIPILSNEFIWYFWSYGFALSLNEWIKVWSSGHGYFRNANKHRLTLYFSLWSFEIAECSWLGLYLRKTEAWIHGPKFRPSLKIALVWKLHDSSEILTRTNFKWRQTWLKKAIAISNLFIKS